jgi:hypothetical protein
MLCDLVAHRRFGGWRQQVPKPRVNLYCSTTLSVAEILQRLAKRIRKESPNLKHHPAKCLVRLFKDPETPTPLGVLANTRTKAPPEYSERLRQSSKPSKRFSCVLPARRSGVQPWTECSHVTQWAKRADSA